MDKIVETTASRLKQLMDEKHLRQVDVLSRCQPYLQRFGIKLGSNALSQYLSGRSRPNQMRLTVLGLALGVSEVWLMGYDVPREREESLAALFSKFSNLKPLTPYTKLKKLGVIHAGAPVLYQEDYEGDWDYADAKYGDGEHYMLDVRGDSMSPTIPNGSEAIVKQQPYAEKGQIVAFAFDGQFATLKRYFPQIDGSILLRGDNPEAPSFVITQEQIKNQEVFILGVVKSYKVNL